MNKGAKIGKRFTNMLIVLFIVIVLFWFFFVRSGKYSSEGFREGAKPEPKKPGVKKPKK
jgi:hypothetical protein